MAKQLFVVLLTFTPMAKAQYVTLTYALSYCSGFVAKTSPQAKSVYLFSAGHCVPGVKSFDNPDNIVMNKDLSKPKEFKLAFWQDPAQTATIHGLQVLFGSYQSADFAIFKIKETEQDLKNLGMEPLIIALEKAPLTTAVRILNSKTLESRQCEVEKYIHALAYKTSVWHWAARLSWSCGLEPGWSGAGIIDQTTNTVYGLVSGGNNTGDCTDYCEINADRTQKAVKGAAYFTRLDFLAKCLNHEGDIVPEGCAF